MDLPCYVIYVWKLHLTAEETVWVTAFQLTQPRICRPRTRTCLFPLTVDTRGERWGFFWWSKFDCTACDCTPCEWTACDCTAFDHTAFDCTAFDCTAVSLKKTLSSLQSLDFVYVLFIFSLSFFFFHCEWWLPSFVPWQWQAAVQSWWWVISADLFYGNQFGGYIIVDVLNPCFLSYFIFHGEVLWMQKLRTPLQRTQNYERFCL